MNHTTTWSFPFCRNYTLLLSTTTRIKRLLSYNEWCVDLKFWIATSTQLQNCSLCSFQNIYPFQNPMSEFQYKQSIKTNHLLIRSFLFIVFLLIVNSIFCNNVLVITKNVYDFRIHCAMTVYGHYTLLNGLSKHNYKTSILTWRAIEFKEKAE